MADNFMKAEIIGIQSWNAYIESNAKEPQTGTQFQRWISINPAYREHISYSKAYSIYDTYNGKGSVPLPGNHKPPSASSSLSTATTRKIQIQLPHSHQAQTCDPQPYNYYNAQYCDTYTHNAYNNQRSRTQSFHPNNTSMPRQPRHKRASTVSSPRDLESAVRSMVISAHKQKQCGLQLTACNHMKAVPVEPKVAQNDLTAFLTYYDLRDIQPKLAQNYIQLKHLQFMEIGDLNALCAHLKLNISEKIRFTFAVKELLRQNMRMFPKTGLRQSKSFDPQQMAMAHAVLSDDECHVQQPQGHNGSKSDALYRMKRNKTQAMKRGPAPYQNHH